MDAKGRVCKRIIYAEIGVENPERMIDTHLFDEVGRVKLLRQEITDSAKTPKIKVFRQWELKREEKDVNKNYIEFINDEGQKYRLGPGEIFPGDKDRFHCK